MAPMPVFINGRYLAQGLTGVQRYAAEMSAALCARLPDARILAPANARSAPSLARLVGKGGGHAWEQLQLPFFARGGVLLNPGNTAPLLGGRQIVVLHDAGVFSTPEAYARPFRLWYKTLQFGLTRRAVTIVTVSEFSKRELAAHLRIPPARITVVGEGADHMRRIAADPSALTAHGLVPQSYVLAVGTLAAHKNLASLGILADRLRARGMTLAITGAAGAAAFQGNGAAGLPAAATYLGRVTDEALKTLFGQAACYVLPSRYEGFGLPAVEAMACGCAVVAADIPALRETCGAAAVFCDPHAPDEIAETVLALLDDAPRLAAMREKALAHVSDLTWANAATRMEALINTLAAG
jgi:glycosyltransferase involved in cell wall biosynthesis